MRSPRVAYFPDSFHEVNGVGHTSRNFVAYAERKGLPFLCVRAGAGAGAGGGASPAAVAFERRGELRTLELRRSRTAVRLEKDLEFDTLFWRHGGSIERALSEFRPDLMHITGPSELGIFGAYFAWKLGVPLAASWHTNVHEYLARRMTGPAARAGMTNGLPGVPELIERATLRATTAFYGLAEVVFAPNAELCGMLEAATGRPCRAMPRGVDTALFTPARRRRAGEGGRLRLGYVGRLSVEKNIALLPRIEAALGDVGIEFFVIGQGGEEEALRRALRRAEFAGVLRGEALATAFADMDLLVFPSHTDTFGNVVLEALASGVPAIVTPDGGPKYIVRDGENGLIVPDEGFAGAIAGLAAAPGRLAGMREAARRHALTFGWDSVFDNVYRGYQEVWRPGAARGDRAMGREPDGGGAV